MTFLRITLVFVFLLLTIASVVHAEPYDITNCFSGETTMLVASQELVVFSYDLKGICRSNNDEKLFDNTSFQCVGIQRVVAGKPTGQGICKFMDKDGDFIVGETTSAGAEGTWKVIYGTGKMKGMTASGKNMYITNSKPIIEGTFQNCVRATGNYELPE